MPLSVKFAETLSSILLIVTTLYNFSFVSCNDRASELQTKVSVKQKVPLYSLSDKVSNEASFDYEVTLRRMIQTIEPLMSILNPNEPAGPLKARRPRKARFAYNALSFVPLVEPDRNGYGSYDQPSLSYFFFCPCEKPLDILGLLSLLGSALLFLLLFRYFTTTTTTSTTTVTPTMTMGPQGRAGVLRGSYGFGFTFDQPVNNAAKDTLDGMENAHDGKSSMDHGYSATPSLPHKRFEKRINDC